MSREVAYRNLASQLRAAVRRGDFADGRALPTEEQLAADNSVSRQTVRRAMQDLVAEGLVYRVAGRGTYPVVERSTFVRQLGSVEDLLALSLDTECELLAPLAYRVDIEAASRLRLTSDDVMTLSLRRFHHDVPFCVTTVTLPPRIGALVEGVPELTNLGCRSRVTVIGVVESRLRQQIIEAEQSVTAVAGTPQIVEHLDCAPGDPVLRVDRLYLDAAGLPVELAVSFFDPRHYSYRINLRRDAGRT